MPIPSEDAASVHHFMAVLEEIDEAIQTGLTPAQAVADALTALFLVPRGLRRQLDLRKLADKRLDRFFRRPINFKYWFASPEWTCGPAAFGNVIDRIVLSALDTNHVDLFLALDELEMIVSLGKATRCEIHDDHGLSQLDEAV
jgi:hypothetical protein